MIQHQAQEQYIRMQVNTASPGELTLLLYNGCLKFLKLALESMENKDYMAKNVHIQKAQAILQELIITLDDKFEISQNLRSLYLYMIERLVHANLRLDQEAVKEVMGLAKELRDTWIEVLKQVKSGEKVKHDS